MIEARQIRAARALVNWSQERLSELSGVARTTIKNIETGQTAPRLDTAATIQQTFEDHGVEFIPGSGVRLKETSVNVLHGDDGVIKLFDDIFQTAISDDSEVLISGASELSEKDGLLYSELLEHLDRLDKAKVQERILTQEGDYHFLNEWQSYRWLPAKYFENTPIFAYGDKIASITWGPPRIVTIIDSPLYAKSYRGLFNFAWDRAEIPSDKKNERS